MGKDVIYNGQVLTLTLFWHCYEPCLWIKNPSQISIPKMQFVGGYPNEYCIFIKDLTEEEKVQITNLDGSNLDLDKEIEELKKLI